MVHQLIAPYDYQQAIKDLLEVSGISQTKIANQIGVTQGRVSQVVNGIGSYQIKYETRHKLYALCLEHGIEVKHIEEGK